MRHTASAFWAKRCANSPAALFIGDPQFDLGPQVDGQRITAATGIGTGHVRLLECERRGRSGCPLRRSGRHQAAQDVELSASSTGAADAVKAIRKSAAFEACDAALMMARASFFRTASQLPI